MRLIFVMMLTVSGFLTARGGEPATVPESKEVPEVKATEQEAAAYREAIKNLGSNEFETREKATRELETAGKKARPFLEAAQKSETDAEIHERVGKILKKWQMVEGFVTLPSGLRYKVLKEGSGDQPAATDTVTVQYVGRLEDGTEFDSSYKHGGKPISFPVNRVIPGWTEGLQLMKPGSKYTLIIPSKLAYGETAPPGSGIGPGATLIFDVELIAVQKQ